MEDEPATEEAKAVQHHDEPKGEPPVQQTMEDELTTDESKAVRDLPSESHGGAQEQEKAQPRQQESQQQQQDGGAEKVKGCKGYCACTRAYTCCAEAIERCNGYCACTCCREKITECKRSVAERTQKCKESCAGKIAVVKPYLENVLSIALPTPTPQTRIKKPAFFVECLDFLIRIVKNSS